jgi:glycosyltransferase involved in cell wall biosynthesis
MTAVFVSIERWLGHFSTMLVSVGDQVRKDLLERQIGRHERFRSISPGVQDFDLPSREEARRRLEIPNESPLVLFVGRLTSIKRPDRLIQAFRLVLEHVPDAKLLIVGDGDCAANAREQARDLGDSVRWLGWRGDLATIYGAKAVTVLTSDNEGMPVTLIEASMAGNPSVATDVGSAREVIVDDVTGFVVDREPSSIADALIRLLTDADQFDRMGRAARQHASLNFGADRLAADHESLYEDLVSGGLKGANRRFKRLQKRILRLP